MPGPRHDGGPRPRELEHSLRALPEHVAVRVLLQQRLAEQDSRSRLHEANGQA